MRMLDDVYGDDQDRFPLEQEARGRIARLEWNDDVCVPAAADEVWYCVPDEDEDVWYYAADRKNAPASARR